MQLMLMHDKKNNTTDENISNIKKGFVQNSLLGQVSATTSYFTGIIIDLT